MTLAKILELTDRVQAAIDAGDWIAAQGAETERRQALEQLIAQRDAGVDLKQSLTQLLERNRRMIGEVHHHQRRVLRDASMIKTGRAAASAYDEAQAKMG